MVLNLDSIRYTVPTMRAKRGRERCPEQIFQLSQLAPACHTRFIENDYTLNAKVQYEGACCSSLPSIHCPLTIIPLVNPASYGFTEPMGYQPFELGYF